MIFHINRATLKPTTTPEQIEAALAAWRTMGETIPSVRSYVAGRDHGGDYEYSCIFVLDDLAGLFEFLTHRATYAMDVIGLELVERLDIFDISDDNDPELGTKIEELHRRRNEDNPSIAGLLAEVPTFRGAGLES
ncbi:Dabb family protein [Mycetocola zhujimingii]|uniref:Dabb family protein n=1 Tax=Mycetocola zhujimingii TaxID=2079792 RepID=UPI000D35138B|nr:Dabb family protein [Mycetocola zhujimingii]AWB86519.1 stress responsive protein [Mycetocola zhujimingii]